MCKKLREDKMKVERRADSPLRFILRVILRAFAVFVVFSFSWVFLYKYIPVRWTPLMLKRSLENVGKKDYRTQRTWVRIDAVSPVMVRAVLAAEDGRFMEHHGIDFQQLRDVLRDHMQKGKPLRGCSTISQQVAKNCFTFCGSTLWRKAFEAYYTILIELMWSKERIMEVYLNIAETGKGVYGVEAAAVNSFGRHASQLTKHQAVSIACVLPSPLRRNPVTVSQRCSKKYRIVYGQVDYVAYPFAR